MILESNCGPGLKMYTAEIQDDQGGKEYFHDNDLEVLKWLRTRNPPFSWDRCPWDEISFNKCTEKSSLEMLEWIATQNPPQIWGKYLYKLLKERSK